MRFPSPLISATLVRRYKRFLADAELSSGKVVTAHCPNSGSLLGCRTPGSPILLSHHGEPERTLEYTWAMTRVGRVWVGINTMHPNRLVEEAIARGVLRELRDYDRVRREVRVSQRSRLDLGLERRGERCYVEVKNVTLGMDGVAAFPDAITARGLKHLKELISLRRRGHRAAAVFVVQRGDCVAFRPADEIDPAYGRWLRRAAEAGVEILPYRARVTPRGIVIRDRLMLLL